jgi:hypothetical protein
LKCPLENLSLNSLKVAGERIPDAVINPPDEGRKVATFAENGISYREWRRRGGRPDYIYSVGDKHDHDIDQFVN